MQIATHTDAKVIDDTVAGRTFASRMARDRSRPPRRRRAAVRRTATPGRDLTFDELADQVAGAAAGLRALRRGPRRPRRADAAQHPRVPRLDLAADFCGATPISIYNSSSARAGRSTSSATARPRSPIVEDEGFLERFLKVRDELPTLEHIVVLHDPEARRPTTCIPTSRLLTITSRSTSTPRPPTVDARRRWPRSSTRRARPGPPKGVMLTHRNIVWTARVPSSTASASTADVAGKRLVSYLPMAHIAERMTSHYLAGFVGLRGHHLPRSRPDRRLPPRGAPEHHLRRAPGVGEDPRRRPGRARPPTPRRRRSSTRPSPRPMPIVEAIDAGTATDEEDATWEFLDEVAFTDRPRRSSASTRSSSPSPAPRRSRPSCSRGTGPSACRCPRSTACPRPPGPMTWTPYAVKAGTVGPAIPGCEVRPRRRRRGDLPGRQRVRRLPRRPREDGRGARRRRLAALRRHRRDRRRRLLPHRRPQEGAHHHRRRQEHQPRQPRGRPQDDPARRPGVRHRRPAAVRRRARGARPRGRAGVGRGSRASRPSSLAELADRPRGRRRGRARRSTRSWRGSTTPSGSRRSRSSARSGCPTPTCSRRRPSSSAAASSPSTPTRIEAIYG